MIEIEKKISPLVETLFPEFYRTEGKRFIAFVKAYYEWMEQSSYTVDGADVAPKTLYYSRNIFDIKDIDKTPDEFLGYFKEKFLKGVTLSGTSDTRNLIKHSLELYRSKGSQKSIELLFSLLFDETVDIYLPSNDILKTSDGEWYRPVYLELEPNDKTKDFVGQQIVGATSTATALVEGFARRNIRGKFVDIIFLSSVSGNFEVGELVGTGSVSEDDPLVIGSLTSITIVTKGKAFSNGDVVDLVSQVSGISGKARISNTGVQTGLIDYELVDGGTGYSVNADVIISEKVLSASRFNSVNTYVSGFIQQESITQQLANLEVDSVQGNLLNSNNLIFGVNSTPALVSAGYVYNGNTTANTKFLSISVHDVANIAIGSITNANTTGSFNLGETVIQVSSNTGTNSFIGTIVLANSSFTLVDMSVGELNNGIVLRGLQSNCIANVTSHAVVNGSFSSADDIVTAGNAAIGNCVITAYTDETATGLIVGSNASAIGVYSIINNFRAPATFNNAYVKNSNKIKTANIFSVSSGNPGGFAIGAITDPETVFINSDFIGGVNEANVPYLNILVSGENSGIGFIDSITVNSGGTLYDNTDTIVFTGGNASINAVASINTYANGTIESITVTTPGSNYYSQPAVSITTSTGSGANIEAVVDYGYGFPKLEDADLTTIISLALTRFSTTIGTIASLTGIDPGSNNNADPFVLVIEKPIAGYGRKNFSLTLTDVTSPFIIGEDITQNINEPAVLLQVSNVSDTFNLRETIEQTRSDSNVVYGEIITANISSNTGTLLVKVANSANSFDTSNSILGLETFTTADVDTVTANTILSVGKGEILSSTNVVSNTVTLTIKRKRFGTSFTSGIPVSGSFSGSLGNVASVQEISNSPVMGNNAIISSVAGVANGTVESIEVIDSGYAYKQNEVVTIFKEGNEFVATGQVNLQKQGVGEGSFLSTKGFLDSNKYIQDSRYYQEYSYEVQAGITLDKYSSILRELVHVAGTELFGSITKVSNAAIEITVPNSSPTGPITIE